MKVGRRHILLLSAMSLMAVASVSCNRNAATDELSPVERKALYDTNSVYYGHFEEYPQNLSGLPIGILDCTAGGFDVVETFLKVDGFDNITGNAVSDRIGDFAGENFQFLADIANGPYVGYVRQDNRAYLNEQLVKDALFLMGNSHYNLSMDDFKSGVKEPVKAIVYASDYMDLDGVDVLSRFLERTGTGVVAVGVLRSGIENMVKDFADKEDVCVGILYPSNALTSRDYESAVRDMAEKAGFTGTLQVYNQEAVGLAKSILRDSLYVSFSSWVPRTDYAGPVVGLSYNDIDVSLMDRYNFNRAGNALLTTRSGSGYSEIQLNSVENYVRYHLVQMVERHRRSGSRVPISAILLVDYRYEGVLDIMGQVINELYDYRRDGIYLYRNSLSRDFRFVLPLESAAFSVYTLLRESNMLALSGTKSEFRPFISQPSAGLSAEYTDSTGAMIETFKYGRKVGTEDIYAKEVPFAPRYVDTKTRTYIENSNPLTYSLIRNTLY